MATIEEQEKLLATLKFTPCTYRISLWGYGGETVMGTVPKQVFDYFKKRRLSVPDYAWDYDAVEELNIPEELQPFEPGSWYECDDLGHASGVSRDSGTLQIDDENGDTILERSLDSLDGTDIGLCCDNEAWVGMVSPGEVVFVGRSSEKGTFFEGEIELTQPFDIEKLELIYDDIDGEDVVHSVMYDGQDIDNCGGGTNGKSSDFCFCLVKESGEWEKYVDYDSLEYTMTDWFPKKINPARVGNYLIKTPGKNGYEHTAKWTGSRWISAWQDDTDEASNIDIKQWRGIDHDPDADVEWDPAAELDKIIIEHKEVIEEIKADPSGWPF